MLAVQHVEARLLMSGVHAVYAPGSIIPSEQRQFGTEAPQPFQAAGRWNSTATDGGGLGQGDVTTLTWSIVADGTLTDTGTASNLIAFMDANFGAGPGGANLTQRPWFQFYQEAHDRMEEISGIDFVYVAYDDGVQMAFSNPGVLGVRSDMRIMGQNIDGPSSILAYNYFPDYGDMVIDTSDTAFYTGAANNFRGFRNVLMHEMGHGIGMAHVESSDSEFLMEPFINLNFDGPQLDDILLMQRHYGDFFEKQGGDDTATAIDLGILLNGATVNLGAVGNSTIVTDTQTDFISIDDESDLDVFSFDATAGGRLTANLTPRGTTYRQGPQGGPSPQPQFDSLRQSNLRLELIGPDGSTVLATADTGGVGVAEAISNFQIPSAGTYYISVSGATLDAVQLYGLGLTFAADQGIVAGTVYNDLNGDGFQNPGETGIVGRTVVLDRILPPVTYQSTDGPIFINDNEAISSVQIIETGNPNDIFTDLNIEVNLFADDIGTLSLYLISPDGTEIRLASRDGARGFSYFVTFDDEAASSIDGQAGNLFGLFRPEMPLSALDGGDINGVWSLRVVDEELDGLVSQLNDWSLSFVAQDRQTVVTNALGQYQFEELAAGDYVVSPVLSPNYTPTIPASGTRSITLAQDEARVNQDFGARLGTLQPPVLTGFGGTISYSPFATILVDDDAALTDLDSPNFNGGSIQVGFNPGTEATNRLSIRNQGTGAGQVGFDGTNVSVGGVVIGTASGGVNTLTINLNAQATPARVQAVIRNLTYSNTSATPADVNRTVTIAVRDGSVSAAATATKTIEINSAPVIGAFGGSLAYPLAQTIYLDTDVTVSDIDSPDLNGGVLRIEFTSGSEANNRLAIRNAGSGVGQTSLSGNVVSVAGVPIGTFAGGVGVTALVVTLNANATPEGVQVLLRNITYNNASAQPVVVDRIVQVTLTDGDGATSLAVSKSISIPPRVLNFTDTAHFRIGTVITLDLDATVAAGAATYNGGTIVLEFISGAEAGNRLGIRNVGNGAGQVGFNTTTGVITFGGSLNVIGSATGGNGTNPFVITFNASATQASVQAVIRALTYGNSATNPANIGRVVRLTLTDGAGASSQPVTKTVNFVPTITEFTNPLAYVTGATMLLDSDVIIKDTDALNFGSGVLRVSFVSGQEAANRLRIRHQGTSGGQVGVSGSTVYYGGVAIGTIAGGEGVTPLTVTFNVQASPPAVQAVARNITYRNTADVPAPLSRIVEMTLSDSQGGVSPAVSKSMSVLPRITDIVGYNANTGEWHVQRSNGTQFSNSVFGSLPTNLGLTQFVNGDFNGDGLADVAARSTTTGAWYVGLNTGSTFQIANWGTWTTAVTWDFLQTGDFDGDGRDDVAAFVKSQGKWYVARSTGSAFATTNWITTSSTVNWGDVHVGDFNGDGRADLTMRNLTTGQFVVFRSQGTTFAPSVWATLSPSYTWGMQQVGDFDGDGLDDVASFVASQSKWYVSRSTGSAFTTTAWRTLGAVTWGQAAAGDFNGDGRTDLFLRDQGTGKTYVLNSLGTSFGATQWGTWSTSFTWSSIQVGDFDGDGRADVAAYVATQGKWYVARSTGSAFTTTQWGSWSTSGNWLGIDAEEWSII
jgi:subtilisin-like proprotein convertase family protein